MSYITQQDITDKIVDDIDMTDYIVESDKAVEDLAEELGVRVTTDIETPVHWRVKRFAICYALMRVCQDHIGKATPDAPEMNKYLIGYNIYKKEHDQVRAEITDAMLTGDVDEMRDRTIQSAVIFRG